jgi:hypothetical protein
VIGLDTNGLARYFVAENDADAATERQRRALEVEEPAVAASRSLQLFLRLFPIAQMGPHQALQPPAMVGTTEGEMAAGGADRSSLGEVCLRCGRFGGMAVALITTGQSHCDP